MHTERFGSYMDNRILIVEDEEKIARFLELELRHEGYEADKASNGREGLDKALTGQYALMVLDVMLPELNGFEVLRRLRKNSDMPVIMLTARDTVMDKVAGLDGEDRIELTHREFELLRVLLENKNIVISRETLLEKVCGYDYLGETNIIDVYVRYLRSKLDDVYQVKWIQTVRGVGYVIRDDE